MTAILTLTQMRKASEVLEVEGADKISEHTITPW